MTVRRLTCPNGHRFTTVEVKPPVAYGSGRALTRNIKALTEFHEPA